MRYDKTKRHTKRKVLIQKLNKGICLNKPMVAKKLASKMTKQDYEELPDKVNEIFPSIIDTAFYDERFPTNCSYDLYNTRRKEKALKLYKDLKNTINKFWKDHKINRKIKMRKKLIVLGLVSTLLVGCGSTNQASDGCCEAPKVTQNDRVTLGVLFSYGIVRIHVNAYN